MTVPRDRADTAPRTRAGRHLLNEWMMLRPDYPPNTAKVRDIILAIEREAAAPDAPAPMVGYPCDHGDKDQPCECGYYMRSPDAPAPQALDVDDMRLLTDIEEAAGRMLTVFEQHDIRFTTTGKPEPLTDAERWEKVAFTLYTELAKASDRAHRIAERRRLPSETGDE